ncbi:hypothetical protein KJ969_04630 [Patescibacteria group bacterium]|nr:hypothetical protein [Patescibacteria group bacterium]MBU1922518.1 hypothetical protein [Patescibacteria group bacterium]
MSTQNTEIGIGIVLDPRFVAPYLACRAEKKRAEKEWDEMVAEETVSDATDISQAVKVYELTCQTNIQPLPPTVTPKKHIMADGACKA